MTNEHLNQCINEILKTFEKVKGYEEKQKLYRLACLLVKGGCK